MAKLEFFDPYLRDDLFHVKKTDSWNIWKDNQYYYKFLPKQKYYPSNHYLPFNLEFMMNSNNQIEGINPVSDIYYQDGIFRAYRTSFIQGTDLKSLIITWNYNLEQWKPFFISFITILQKATKKSYVFPDLFTPGNVLYDQKKQCAVLIDNDGMQVQNRFVECFDYYSQQMNSFITQSIRYKYFDPNLNCFTSEYNYFAFYSWFLMEFLQINLLQILHRPMSCQCQLLSDALKEKGFPIDSTIYYHIINLLNPYLPNVISVDDFNMLCEEYTIETYDSSRKLVSK